jgi:hypothetical protein
MAAREVFLEAAWNIILYFKVNSCSHGNLQVCTASQAFTNPKEETKETGKWKAK